MPVETPIKRRMECLRTEDILLAVQYVVRLVGVLACHASEGKFGKVRGNLGSEPGICPEN
jgi:hypothetical protein